MSQEYNIFYKGEKMILTRIFCQDLPMKPVGNQQELHRLKFNLITKSRIIYQEMNTINVMAPSEAQKFRVYKLRDFWRFGIGVATDFPLLKHEPMIQEST